MIAKKKMTIQQKGEVDTLKNGLVFCLELDETTGTTAIDSHSTNDFTNSNATINQSGILDKSYLFNGTNSTLRNDAFSNLVNNTNQVSISFWFNLTTQASNPRMLFEYSVQSSANNAFQIYSWDGGKSVVGFQQDSLVNRTFTKSDKILTGNNNDGTWRNCIVIFDRTQTGLSQQKIYIDGVLSITFDQTSVDNIDENYGNYSSFNIGSRNSAQFWYNGSLDQSSLWNRVLTQEEISTIYNSGKGLAYTNW